MTAPDFDLFRDTILRRRQFDRVPLIELGVDTTHMDMVRQKWGGLEPLGPEGWKDPQRRARGVVEFWSTAGYDFVRPALPFGYTNKSLVSGKDTASEGDREWMNEGDGDIKDRETFESYPWPTQDDLDFSELDYAAANLPKGMGLMLAGGGGFLEWAMYLTGFTGFCMMIYQEPDLVKDIVNRIGEHILASVDAAFQRAKIESFIIGDDMGFRTATIMPPDVLRELILPWHKKLVDLVHGHGAISILHSCGQLSDIMDDLIDDVGIDGKHSYENNITPVWEAKKLWGDRVAILGGVDMDILARAELDECRAAIDDVLTKCAPGGGYCLGTGNTVANYVKPENYLAILEAGRDWKNR